MTELAYLRNADAAYVRAFDARVTALPPGGVVLDLTYFYPVGGGQPADHGALSRPGETPTPVVDVTKSGPNAIHRIRRSAGAAPLPFQPGDRVHGEIDWARRHRHMRLHTGQHLVSALVFLRTGVRTRDATMGGEGGTIDLEGPLPAQPTLEGLAEEANALLASDRRVTLTSVPRAEWERNPSPRSGLVPLPRQVDPVRVVEIDGLDSCPCGGTHVRSTAEVGRVVLDPPVPIALGGLRLPFHLTPADGTPTRPA